MSIRRLKPLLPYLARHRGTLGAGLLFVVLGSLLGLVGPRIIGWAVDAIRSAGGRDELRPYIILLLSVEAAAAIFIFYQRTLLLGTSRKIDFELRNDFFSHLLTLPFSFFNQQKTGDIMARATNDMEAVRMFIGPGLWNGVELIVLTAVALPIMFSISPTLTVVSLIPMAALPLITVKVGPMLHGRFTAVQEQFSTLSAHVQENLNGIRVVKGFTREKSVGERFDEMNREYVRRNMSLVRVYGSFFPLLMAVASLGLVIVVWLGGRQVIRGVITLGDMVAFTQYHALLTWPMIALGWVINLLERGSASWARIAEILETEPRIRDRAGIATTFGPVRGEIEFRRLSFSYSPEGPVILNDINLLIPAGQTLGITGPTGSGKSTLLHLIPRLFQPAPGELFIDGVELHDIPLKTLRSGVGLVPQDSFLFSDTVIENIGFGLDEPDRDTLIDAARLSGIRDEIEAFPDSWDQVVGERGVTLSGGQKQRVALARAIATDPAILLLDDAFANVDTGTEEEILEAVRSTLAERTTLIVSHRVSTLRHADQIIWLEAGRIIERGTHEDLIGVKGRYAAMVERQALLEELESLS